jgi:hypothetical protein
MFENFHFCSHLCMVALHFTLPWTVLRKWRTLNFQDILKNLCYKISTLLIWDFPHHMNSSIIDTIILNIPTRKWFIFKAVTWLNIFLSGFLHICIFSESVFSPLGCLCHSTLIILGESLMLDSPPLTNYERKLSIAFLQMLWFNQRYIASMMLKLWGTSEEANIPTTGCCPLSPEVHLREGSKNAVV